MSTIRIYNSPPFGAHCNAHTHEHTLASGALVVHINHGSLSRGPRPPRPSTCSSRPWRIWLTPEWLVAPVVSWAVPWRVRAVPCLRRHASPVEARVHLSCAPADLARTCEPVEFRPGPVKGWRNGVGAWVVLTCVRLHVVTRNEGKGPISLTYLERLCSAHLSPPTCRDLLLRTALAHTAPTRPRLRLVVPSWHHIITCCGARTSRTLRTVNILISITMLQVTKHNAGRGCPIPLSTFTCTYCEMWLSYPPPHFEPHRCRC